MSRRFEVSVPLVVGVRVDDDGSMWVTDAKVTRGFPGFFSEAEAAGGVWEATDENDAWGAEGLDQSDIRATAWMYVRASGVVTD